MAATTRHAVYRGILADMKAAISTPVGTYIYVSAEARFTQEDRLYVQIVPGGVTAEEPISGTGLTYEEFTVVVWKKLDSDQARRSDERITDAASGALVVVEAARVAMTQGWADGTATVPVVWLRGSLADESDDHPGWVYFSDTYRVGYEVAWAVQQVS